MHEAAWLILRIVYGWMFLFPLTKLLKNFDMLVDTAGLVVPFFQRFFAIVMVVVMIYGGLSIMIGFYAQIGGFLLLCYCLLGVVAHYRLARKAISTTLSNAASSEDQQCLKSVIGLAVLGNRSSGQKNVVLAAVGCFFMLMGSGPLSLTSNLF